jgi:hypothetical protein
MAEPSLDELWKTISNGDEGARETLIEQASQTLRMKFLRGLEPIQHLCTPEDQQHSG